MAKRANSAILIFVKNPIPGKVKTRLGKTIGYEQSAQAYILLMKHVKEVVKDITAEKYVYYGDFINKDDLWSKAHFAKKLQVQEDLGMRMHHALKEVLDQNEIEKAILIGTDCPEISPEILEAALGALDNHDAVFGPAEDGGYYLVGLKKPQIQLFQKIEWSTQTVLQETMKRAENSGISTATTTMLSDVDYEEDWNRFKDVMVQKYGK